jgi:hypothetical protein
LLLQINFQFDGPNADKYYGFALGMQSFVGAIRDSTSAAARWMFSFKYLVSALTLPSLFGGKALTDGQETALKNLDRILLTLCVVIPAVGYVFIFLTKYLQADFV